MHEVVAVLPSFNLGVTLWLIMKSLVPSTLAACDFAVIRCHRNVSEYTTRQA